MCGIADRRNLPSTYDYNDAAILKVNVSLVLMTRLIKFILLLKFDFNNTQTLRLLKKEKVLNSVSIHFHIWVLVDQSAGN